MSVTNTVIKKFNILHIINFKDTKIFVKDQHFQ